ncbi:hypothetical protein [Marinobacter salicampi]|uniref:hypothetical protein n=1 Tax=Marinobacter salicampi TaxID=435907 RepID=UPI00140B09D1|nr:hypothetical protein [Marinobacter salicampi]
MYQLVFKGESTPGTELAEARANARTLFKASLDQIERMFSGQPVVIRNKLDETQAEKYRLVLHKHGMVAYVEPMAGAGTQAVPRPAPSSYSSPERNQPDPVTEPRPESRPAPRQVSPPSLEPGDRLALAGGKADDILAGSALSLDPVGVTLAEHKEVPPPMFQNLDSWSLAPPGSDLAEKRDQPPPIVPDVSHLSLIDDEDRT